MKKKYIDTVQIYNYECFLDSEKRVVRAITDDNRTVYPYKYNRKTKVYDNISGYYKADYIRQMMKNEKVIFS